jgi:hypothetical protein
MGTRDFEAWSQAKSDSTAAHKRYLIRLLCLFATSCAYIECTGFSVEFMALCKQERVSEHVEGVVLGLFYWGCKSNSRRLPRTTLG